MKRARVAAGLLLSLLAAGAARADCFKCGFEGTDLACLKKSSGWKTCTTQSGPSGQTCTSEGDSCGSGGGMEPEEPIVWNAPCARERLFLVDVETRRRQPEVRLSLVAVALGPQPSL